MGNLYSLRDYQQAWRKAERKASSGLRTPETRTHMAKKVSPLALFESTLQTRAIKSLSPRLRELVDMLEMARPGGSATEEAFLGRYIDPLPNMQRDDYGNRYCIVGKQRPTIAWSSHTDTVHSEEGTQALELVTLSDGTRHIQLDQQSEADCLGADCTAGVWLMRRLILGGKPGLYIFHRDEESGGLGSKWIAKNKPELVTGIHAMIALDRRGYDSVITEQTTGRTASDKFAKSLAQQLGGQYAPDDGGIFTDSAFYAHLIPECTNLSIGYFSQHSRHETLDIEFVDALLPSLLRLDYSALEIAREPREPVSRYRNYGSGYYRGYVPQHYRQDAWMSEAEDRHFAEQWAGQDRYEPWEPMGRELERTSDHELAALIRRNPEATAMLLRQWDMTEKDVYDAIAEYAEEKERRKAL